MTRSENELIAYFEARSQRRRDTALLVAKAVVVIVLFVIVAWLGIRTFLHFTEIGAGTNVTVTANGNAVTTKTPVAIIP